MTPSNHNTLLEAIRNAIENIAAEVADRVVEGKLGVYAKNTYVNDLQNRKGKDLDECGAVLEATISKLEATISNQPPARPDSSS